MRRLTIERSMSIILFMLIFALAVRIPVDTDTWWHLRSGEYILQNGFIYTDPFSFSFADQPWIDHSWGAQVLLSVIWRVGGMYGLAFFVAGMATLGMIFIYRMSAGNTYLRAFAIVLGAATAAVFWSPRPQMFSFALSALLLLLLHLYKREKTDRLWMIPILMAVWGNIHAGFSIGFIFLGGTIAGEIFNNLFRPTGDHTIGWRGIRKLIVITLISLAALVINPYGINMLLVPFQTVGIGALQNFIQEWNSPNFHERQTWPFVFLIIAVLGAVGGSKRRLDWTDFMLVSGTMFMGLMAGRNIAVFAVVATPVLTYHLASIMAERGWLQTTIKRATPQMARINILLLLMIGLACFVKVVASMDAEMVDTVMADTLPVGAVDYMQTHDLPPNMFNSYNWGGYLIHALPDFPVFVDGRTDLYGDSFLTNDYLSTALGNDGWRETLTQYGINTVVVETPSGLALRLRDEAGWTVLYEDPKAIVIVRDVPIEPIVNREIDHD